MSRLKGREVAIKGEMRGGVSTNGMTGVIAYWDKKVKKYNIDFRNGFCGWYKRSEFSLRN